MLWALLLLSMLGSSARTAPQTVSLERPFSAFLLPQCHCLPVLLLLLRTTVHNCAKHCSAPFLVSRRSQSATASRACQAVLLSLRKATNSPPIELSSATNHPPDERPSVRRLFRANTRAKDCYLLLRLASKVASKVAQKWPKSILQKRTLFLQRESEKILQKFEIGQKSLGSCSPAL